MQLNALRDGVSVTHIHTKHKADEIAAASHEEMPWMAPATEEVWHGLRRSAREGLQGLRFNPLVLVGTQRGWSSATPGKLMQTVLRERHAGLTAIVDEVEKPETSILLAVRDIR